MYKRLPDDHSAPERINLAPAVRRRASAPLVEVPRCVGPYEGNFVFGISGITVPASRERRSCPGGLRARRQAAEAVRSEPAVPVASGTGTY